MSTPIFKLEDIDLDDIDLDKMSDDLSDTESAIFSEKNQSKSGAIAIIGMDGRVGDTEDMESFWQMLIQEREGIRALSEQRKRDLDDYLSARGIRHPLSEKSYVKGTFLTDIAGFDHNFFGISQQEARYMDPNQRIFLETAWKALEDAGYGGKEIRGTDTGVFVGFSTDFGEAYRQMLSSLDPDASEVAVAGNIKSIIASRLSYHLDLRGPALLIDTACSSGLMAVYMACKSIRSGECSMAIAGAVKCDLVPLIEDKESGIGIKDIQDTFAQDGHTRTFDDACAGTAAAEGSFAFVLKPLEAAMRDGDTIRAVILGGAANQDGASNGITAPNSEAQEELIVRALTDAGVSAESISYIEAHGTATRLGDPIEISGIQRAFKHFTNRLQFCAIGSLKTNIGHLDNAAGLGGMAKVILAMQHRVLPASLNFSVPNRNISFVQSPVYVNSQTVSWPSDFDVLRAGINSFGLSGTNCHLVLESAPLVPARTRKTEIGALLLPLSAKNLKALRLLAAAYSKRLAEHDLDLVDAVLTASRGRLHHNVRLAVVFETRDQVCSALQRFAELGKEALPDPCLHYGEHRLIFNEENRRWSTDITESEVERLSTEALAMKGASHERPSIEVLHKWAGIYIAGAVPPWNYVTANMEARRIPLPTYPFDHVRCWAEPSKKAIVSGKKQSHPLLGTSVVDTMGHTLVKSCLRPETHWELAEHKIQGVCLLPGTAFIEMTVEHIWKSNGQVPVYFKDLIFEQPFTVDEGSSKELHLLIEDEGERKYFRFASRLSEGEWIQHAAGYWHSEKDIHSLDDHAKVNLEGIRERLNRSIKMNTEEDVSRGLELGERWRNSVVSGMIDDATEEFLIELSLPAEFRAEKDAYHFHPALTDTAINAANNMMGEGELYLPLSYGELIVHRSLPAHFFAHLRKTSGVKGGPIQRFDINLCDTEGSLVAEIRNYCIKSATKEFGKPKDFDSYGYRQVYRAYQPPVEKQFPSGAIVLAGKASPAYDALLRALKDKGHRIIEVSASGDWEQALKPLKSESLALAIFSWYPSETFNGHYEDRVNEENEAVYQGFAFLKAWTTAKLKAEAGLIALTHRAWTVEDTDTEAYPGQAALGGLWRVGALEFETLYLRCIDHDEKTSTDVLLTEFGDLSRPAFLAYRNGQVYEPVMQACTLPIQAAHPVQKDSGMFVLSGGTGSLGIEVARLLVRRGVRKLALLGYRTVPPRESWRDLLETSKDTVLLQRLKQWLELEQNLDVLEVRSILIEDYRAVSELISELRQYHGRIQGVIHLAGRAGDGFLFQKEEETFRKVYAPKANGALNLHVATLEDRPEIFIQFSSISSVLLNPGQSDYTAANMVLDSLAEFRRRIGLPALSIQWPAWRETGIAWRMDAVDEDELYTPLNTNEALDLFDRVLWRGEELPPVLMPGRKRRNNQLKQKMRPLEEAVPYKDNQVVLSGIAEPDEIEMAVAGVWARTLSEDKLDAHDEFGSMGGNSLLTSQMLREYERLFPGTMEIADLFTYTTIYKQAVYLKSQLGLTNAATENLENLQAGSKNDLDEILDLVAKGEMTVEESSSRILSKNNK